MTIMTGSIVQFTGKISINGTVLSAPELSTVARLLNGTVFNKVGEIRKDGQRGRATNIWQVDTDHAGMKAIGMTVERLDGTIPNDVQESEVA